MLNGRMVRRKKTHNPSPLLYADSDVNADQLYFGQAFVPDAFLSFGLKGKKYAFASALEISRLKTESSFDVVYSLEEWRQKAARHYRKKAATIVDIVRLVAREFKISEFVVATDFPAGIAFKLRAARVPLQIAEGPLFPGRCCKSEVEAKAVQEGNAASAAGIRAAEKMLRAAKIKNGKLIYDGRPLTSQRVRQAIEIACLEKGALAAQTIVAGGDQACDPHCRGSGPLRANQLIIIDVFPRVARTGYFGDMTRTFLKGRASPEQRRLVHTVREAHQLAIDTIKAGISGARIHSSVESHFEKTGYQTKTSNGIPQGFIHGTGHGLGLEIHEPPRLSRGGPRLKAGNVVTVEPGLYYRGLGACRIEDVVLVTKKGCEMLSKCHYRWEFT